MVLRSRFTGFVLICFALFGIITHPALLLAGDAVFGPKICQKKGGSQTVYSYSFSVAKPERGYILKIHNGGLDDDPDERDDEHDQRKSADGREADDYERLSGCTITLNGVQVVGPDTVTRDSSRIEVPVQLLARNSLTVTLQGRSGAAMVLRIYPYVVIDSPKDGKEFSAQPIEVRGHLHSTAVSVQVNGIAAGLDKKKFTASGVPLAAGYTLVTAVAQREGGFSGSDSVGVSFNSLAPTITISYPTNGLTTNQDVTPVYSVSDPHDQNPVVSITPPPPYVAEGAYHMVITAVDHDGHQAQEARDFVIDKTAPVIAGLAPPEGGITNNRQPLISAGLSDALSGIDAASIRITLDGVDVTALASVTAGGIAYTPSAPLADGNHGVAVTAKDRAGNVASATWQFVIDATAPVITITYPPEGLITNQDVTPAYTVQDASDPSPTVSIAPVPPYTGEGVYYMAIAPRTTMGISPKRDEPSGSTRHPPRSAA